MHSGELYTPEVASVIAGGTIPEYNVFPFSGVYRDLSGLLENPATDFANNVQAAASGMMGGLVYSDPQELASHVLFYGRQIEAARQLERQHNTDNPPPAADKEMAEDEQPLSLPPATSDAVTQLGKVFGHLVTSELVVSLPTATLNTLTPSPTPALPGMVHTMALAGFHLPF